MVIVLCKTSYCKYCIDEECTKDTITIMRDSIDEHPICTNVRIIKEDEENEFS